MELPKSIRFSSHISDPEVYINEMFQLHPDTKHDNDSGAIEIKNEIIDSSFRYLHLEEYLFLFTFRSYSPVDIEYDFIPNPKSEYLTLGFYFTESRSKNPLYVKIDEKFYSSDQISMFFNGNMNAGVFIKSRQKAFGIRLEIHKNWLLENIKETEIEKIRLLKSIINKDQKGIVYTDAAMFLALVKSIIEVMENGKVDFRNLKLKSHFYELIQQYFECYLKNEITPEKNQNSGELKSALNYLEKSIYKDFPGNEYLAELCKMSTSSFDKRFKIAFRITAVQYFRNLKMKEAVRLLQLGTNVKEVAYKVGYKDVSAFGRSFKNIYGTSPASYVKK